MQANLAALKAQPKFVDEPGTIYNGMRPEEMRQLTKLGSTTSSSV